jgi:radical SAM superfamily enzyme YgiQ (UPF0313 family)
VKPYRVVLVGLRADELRPQVPLALGYMKAIAEADERLRGRVEVEIIEAWRGDDMDALARRVAQARPDMAGFSCYIWNVAAVERLSSRLAELAPSVLQVAGGPEISPRPEQFMRRCAAHLVVEGEGEETFKDLLAAALDGGEFSKVRGLVYRRGEELLHTEPRPLIENLDSIPSPYLTGALRVPDGAEVPLESSRGCKFKCRFCTWAVTGLRNFSNARVLAELEAVSKLSSKVFLQVISADAFEDPSEAEGLLNGMNRAGRGSDWIASVETHLGHWKGGVPDWLDSPRYHLFAGVQTTNPSALKVSARFFQRDKNEATIEGLKRRAPNASVHLELILGLPGDDLEGFRGSLDWALSMDPTTILVYRLLMLHGSGLRERAAELGIEYRDEAPYLAEAVRGFPREEIARAQFLAYAAGLFRCDPVLRPALFKLGLSRRGRRPLPFVSVIDDLLAELEAGSGFKTSEHYGRTGAAKFTSFDDVLWIDRNGNAEHEAGRPPWLRLSSSERADAVRALRRVASGAGAEAR